MSPSWVSIAALVYAISGQKETDGVQSCAEFLKAWCVAKMGEHYADIHRIQSSSIVQADTEAWEEVEQATN